MMTGMFFNLFNWVNYQKWLLFELLLVGLDWKLGKHPVIKYYLLWDLIGQLA